MGLRRFRHDWVTELNWKWKKVLVAQLCLTLCDPMDCSPPGSSVHGIFQASVLEWAAISFSRWLSWPRDRTWVSWTAGRFFTDWATRKPSRKAIAYWQYCDSFRRTAKESSHTYACIHSPSNALPIQAAKWHSAEFPVLYSRSLLVIHFKYSHMYLSIPNSATILSRHLSPQQP